MLALIEVAGLPERPAPEGKMLSQGQDFSTVQRLSCVDMEKSSGCGFQMARSGA